MKLDHKAAIIDRYRARLARHGAGIKALASGTEQRRTTRFDVLSAIGIESGCSVLDVGCGFADFYGYLRERGVDVAYTGVDIVPDLVEHARASFPGLDLQVRDIQEDPFPERSFDFVVASQVFNYDFGDEENMSLVSNVMQVMFRAAKRGLAVDFVTSYVDFKEGHLKYYSPEEMFRLAKTMTKRVTLRHDYPLYEFCVYLFPDFAGWRK